MADRPEALLRHLRRLASAPAVDPESDAELLGRYVRHRDEEAFAALVRRHGGLVLGVCRRVLGDDHRAEDAFQAAWLVFARKAATVRPAEGLAGWLQGVARQTARNVLRGEARHRKYEGAARNVATPPRRPGPLDELTARELLLILDEEVRRLPEINRLPVLCCCWEGLSIEETAQRLGWTAGSVKGRLERGRARLHARLARRGLSLSAALAVLDVARGQAASLPGALIPATVRLVREYAAGGPVTSPVAALAELTWQGMGRGNIAAMLATLLIAGSAFGSLLWPGLRPGHPAGPQVSPNDGRPAVQAVAGSGDPATTGKAPRTDRHGDPLPAEAVARLGTVRLRHGGGISSLTFTADGREIVSHSNADGVRFWDTATGKETGHLPRVAEANAFMTSLALTPDGKQIITLDHGTIGGGSSTFRVWDRAERKVVREAVSYTHLFSFRLSPDGKEMIVQEQGFRQDSWSIWDVATLKPLRRRLEDDGKRFWGGTPSADGKTFVANVFKGGIRFWDVATGRKVQEITDDLAEVASFALSPDGRLLATVGMKEFKDDVGMNYRMDHFIRLWDVAAGKEVRRLTMPARQGRDGQPQGFGYLEFTGDGKTLVSSGGDGVVRFWDPATGKETHRVPVDPRGAGLVALSPDRKTLAVVASTGIHVAGYHDATPRLIVGGGSAIRLIDRATGKDRLSQDEHQGVYFGPALTPDGRAAVTLARDNALLLWDPRTGKERSRLEGHSKLVTAVRALPDGRTLLSASLDGTLRVWDLAAGKEVRRVNAPFKGLGFIAVSADGKTLALTQGEGVVAVLNFADGKEIRRLPVGGEGVEGAGFTADGKRLVVWARDHTARVWDVAGGRELRQFRLDEGFGKPPGQKPKHFFAYTGAVSPDGRLIAYGNQFNFLTIFDPATGKQSVRLKNLPADPRLLNYQSPKNLPDSVSALAFTPDGRTLAWSGRRDPAIHLIELVTGRERGLLTGHRGRVETLTCSADGKVLISGSEDTTALVWDLRGDPSKPLARADLDASWGDLAGADAGRAYQAIRRLAAAPAEAVPYLDELLRPAAGDTRNLPRLIADLQSDQFAVRDRATKQLKELGEVAEPALRRALQDDPSLEARRRIDALLELRDRETMELPPEKLRALRAIEVLEWAGTADARAVLRRLSRGQPGVRLTRAAQAALDRLDQKPTAP